jgi:hypothetical protein
MKCDFCSAPLINGISRHIVYGPPMAVVAVDGSTGSTIGGWGADGKLGACGEGYSLLLHKDYDAIVGVAVSQLGLDLSIPADVRFLQQVKPLFLSMYQELVIMQ